MGIAAMLLDRLRFPKHVGRLLDSLAADGWRAVPVAGQNVDHVLVGPGGLLTIETTSHGGRIHARSVEPGMLGRVWAQRKVAEPATGLTADPLLVFSRGVVTPAVSRQRGVLVLSARMLKGHLARRPVVLSRRQVEDLHARLTAAVA
jgi:Nuclease-related domain